MSRAGRRALAAALGAGASLALASPAHALLCGTFLNPLTLSASAVSFGDYTALDPLPGTTTGTITLSCTLPIDALPSFTVALSKGGSATYAPRRMTVAGGQLTYNLYTAADYLTVWGDGTGGTVTQAYNSGLLFEDIVFTVYGRTPAEQWTRAGAYQDTVVVTVTY